jgi:hypothetical protein
MEKITMQLKTYEDAERIKEIFRIRGTNNSMYDFNSLNSYYSLDAKNNTFCTTSFPQGHRLINNKEELNPGTVYEIY